MSRASTPATVAPRGGAGFDDLEALVDGLAPRLRVAVVRLARLLRQQDDSGFGATTLSALGTVAAHGPLTLGELAACEQVAPPTMTKVVDRLVSAGLVSRTNDPTDRRVSRVTLSDAGNAYLVNARDRRTQWLTQRLQALDPDELGRLLAASAVLEKLATLPEADT